VPSTRSLPATDAAASRSELVFLFELARDGDAAAVPSLLRELRPLVSRAARRYLSRPSDIDDVVQETWLTLITSWDAIRTPECLTGWVWRVASNLAIRHSRAQCATSLRDEVADASVDAGAELSDGLLRDERRRCVRRAVARLGSAERHLLEVLSEDDRPNYVRASEVLGRPIGSIGPTRMRALARLSRDPEIASLR
jgi:RNA polymerase sigma factor (sigma-70 family)